MWEAGKLFVWNSYFTSFSAFVGIYATQRLRRFSTIDLPWERKSYSP